MKRIYSLSALLSCVFLISTLCLTSLQIAGAQLSTYSGLPSHGTIIYSPTPTPSPTPASPPSSNMVNLIWFQDIEGNQIDAGTLKAHKINFVLLTVGTFAGTSELTLWHDPSQYAQAIAACHAQGIKILAGQMTCFNFQTPMDMANTALTNAAIQTAVNFVQQYGFDGWADFCEAWTGSSVADFNNYNARFAQAMHGINKMFVWGNMCYEGMGLDLIQGMYSAYSGADFVVPEFYELHAHPGFLSLLHYCFQVANSESPLVPSISAGRGLGYTIQDYFDGIDNHFNNYPEDLAKYGGISVWGDSTFNNGNPMFMTDSDWALWDNWSRKNG